MGAARRRRRHPAGGLRPAPGRRQLGAAPSRRSARPRGTRLRAPWTPDRRRGGPDGAAAPGRARERRRRRPFRPPADRRRRPRRPGPRGDDDRARRCPGHRVDHHPVDPHAAGSPAVGAAGRAGGLARRRRAGCDPRAGDLVALSRWRRPGDRRRHAVVAGRLTPDLGRGHGRAAGVLPGAAHRRRRRCLDAAGARVPRAPPRRPAANGADRHVARRGGDDPAHDRLPRPRPDRTAERRGPISRWPAWSGISPRRDGSVVSSRSGLASP